MSYTPQLTESVRIVIGKMLIAHEIFKLLPDSDYEKLKAQINSQWAEFSDTVTIRDFWNLIDSLMMGYKLKNITRDITSQQYTWSLKRGQAIAQLRFSTYVNGLSSNEKTATEIKTFLEGNPTELRRITIGTHNEFPKGDTRYLDPIIVLENNGTFFVHDGNGRLLKAIIEKRDTIDAYIGINNGVSKSNHWIPTSYLRRLSDERQKDLLVKLLQESDNAVFEFENRAYPEERFKQEILSEVQQ